MTRRTMTLKRQYGTIVDEFVVYSDDCGKTWRWECNNNYCPVDACREYNIPCDPRLQHEAVQRQNTELLVRYRENMKNHVPSAEEQYEMAAAFGSGQKVVNVITGQEYTT